MVHDFFWDLRQDREIASAGVDASAAKREAQDARKEMGDRVDKLAITCMAMWSLLRQATKFTEQDLMDRVREIDLMDGSEDGKVTRQIAKCPKCERVMSPRHSRCLYCGEERLILSAFDQIV